MNQKRFLFLSDAKKFQRKKQMQGKATRLIHNLGCAHPHRIVQWRDKPVDFEIPAE